MKSLILVCVLVVSSLAQSAGTRALRPTPIAGESWLHHLHRTFEETSMGKTGRLGPAIPANQDEPADWQPQPAADSTKLIVTLHGSDLYRLNCWGCHGESGLGVPPEINSVINPTRAMSAQLIVERMKARDVDISWANATELANQSRAALLERLHKGGTDMPAFPHLSDPEVRAILAYLKLLAGVRGAEKQQIAVNESGLHIGEHIVKSTCHICHDAAGPNPDSKQLFNGVIPPLSTLTMRTSLPTFERKVRSGAPIQMGAPPTLCRGRMPVFYYLSEEEVADAYLYLRLYPPVPTVRDPLTAATEPGQAKGNILRVAFRAEPKLVMPRNASDLAMIVFQISVGTWVGLLLAVGFWFTLREVKRLTAISDNRTSLTSVESRVAKVVAQSSSDKFQFGRHSQHPPTPNADTEEQDASRYKEQAFHHDDYRRFERSWLARWVEGEDEAA